MKYSSILSIDMRCSIIKKGQLNKNIKLSYKAPLVGSRSNRFWNDLKKFREWKSHSYEWLFIYFKFDRCAVAL